MKKLDIFWTRSVSKNMRRRLREQGVMVSSAEDSRVPARLELVVEWQGKEVRVSVPPHYALTTLAEARAAGLIGAD